MYNITHYNRLVTLSLSCLLLAACSQKPAHEPLAGEYGQSRIYSEDISDDVIDAINQSEMPRPKDLNSLELGGFDVIAKQSPYRVVMVVYGKAINSGAVQMRWLGGIDAVSKSPTPPKQVGMGNVLETTDSKAYQTNENVLLILAGGKVQPSTDRPATITMNLGSRENLHIDRMRIEVWQGKGKYWSFWDKLFWSSFLVGPILLWVGLRNRRR